MDTGKDAVLAITYPGSESINSQDVKTWFFQMHNEGLFEYPAEAIWDLSILFQTNEQSVSIDGFNIVAVVHVGDPQIIETPKVGEFLIEPNLIVTAI